jgi:hypothetical protein
LQLAVGRWFLLAIANCWAADPPSARYSIDDDSLMLCNGRAVFTSQGAGQACAPASN